MGIILAIIVFLFIASIFVINKDNSYVLVQNKFNKKIRIIQSHMAFKQPFPMERVIGSLPIEKTVNKYINLGDDGMEFELSYKVHEPVQAHVFMNYFDDYIFEFIYNLYNLDMSKEQASKVIFDKLSKAMYNNGITLKSFEFK